MPRLTAFNILRSAAALELRGVDRAAERAGLEPRDRGLVRRLVGTDTRRRATLRAMIAAFARGKPNADVAAHLRLGFVQLFFLDQVPPHAAVSETVGATHITSGPSKARYVNAVLRAAQKAVHEGYSGDPRRDLIGRERHFDRPIFRDPESHPLLWAEDALSMPALLVKRWARRYGQERALELARQGLNEPPLSVRAVGVSRDALAEELVELEPRTTDHPALLLFDTNRTEALVHSPAFLDGRATVQGETALRAAEALQAQPGERLLELCAAPGGKTAVLAGAGAAVLAVDINELRLERLRETVARLGVTELVELLVSDGTAAVPQEAYDGVLIDAPCSNTGVLAKRPGARWRYGPATRASLVELQTRLLHEGAERVRPAGRLVWSTCSLEPEENGQLLRAFLAAQPEFSLEEEHEALPDDERGPVDGGYTARLRRQG